MIDFNGTTSRIENTTANLGVNTIMTLCAWTFADGQGESSAGHITCLDEATNSVVLRHNNSNNVLRFGAIFTGVSGAWNFTATDSQWNAVAVSYDGGATTNDPVVRVNFANVSVTEVSTPTLSFVSPNTGYCIGNNTGATRTWNGMIAYVQGFNVILTAPEMDQCLRRPGSVRRGLKLFQPMLHSGYLADLSGNGFNGTGTDLANRVGGPPCAPLYGGQSFSPHGIQDFLMPQIAM